MVDTLLPQFSNIDISSLEVKLDKLLQENLLTIDALLKETSFTWDSLMRPLEDLEAALERLWSPFNHLHAVVNSKALRACYKACLPKLTAYETSIGQNQALYQAIQSIDKTVLDAAQVKIIHDALRDFKLSGVALSEQKKRRFEEILTRLAELSHQFENHILDATDAYQLHITDAKRLKGLPEYALQAAAHAALEKSQEGSILNLEFPCYLAVVTHADDRALREEIYRAYVTRASDEGPNAGEFDNTALMAEILSLRHEKATLLGFKNYADLSLETKMAASPARVEAFLADLCHRGHHQAVIEFQDLQAFAKQVYQMDKVEAWDIAYLSEKKREEAFAISEEELRPYFPLPKVMEGLFSIIETLYGMTLAAVREVDTWHSDVECFCIKDELGQVRGYIYTDLFARANKRGGAWMDALQTRRKLVDGRIELPIATLTCNFAKPAPKSPATLSHDEVLTLFHEFGHCLQHVLTTVDYLDASGINGVEWDAVELPSQFFENYCWEKDALQQLTAHIATGESLPLSLYEKMLEAKNFQSAMALMRQLEFSIFDFRIHQDNIQQADFIQNTLNAVRKETTVVPIAPFNRFQHSFGHIFAGGYAAGYYSYKWAEVLSSDAFSRFEEEGVFNPKTGRDFLHQILEVGGAKEALDAFIAFRGREPKADALLRHNGIQ